MKKKRTVYEALDLLEGSCVGIPSYPLAVSNSFIKSLKTGEDNMETKTEAVNPVIEKKEEVEFAKKSDLDNLKKDILEALAQKASAQVEAIIPKNAGMVEAEKEITEKAVEPELFRKSMSDFEKKNYETNMDEEIAALLKR